MALDPLQQFRGGAAVVPAARHATNATTSEAANPRQQGYQAFGVAGKRQHRLRIRPSQRAWERISYGYLYRLVEDGAFGTQLGLIYSFAFVVIKGRNLQPLADAIDAELCEYVQQFDPRQWASPPDAKAPFVDSIAFHVETRVEASDRMLAEIAQPSR